MGKSSKVNIYAPKLEQKYDFNSSFRQACRTLRKHVRDDWDSVIAISGTEGVGKSVLANWIGFKTDKNYTLEKNCIYAPNEKMMIDAIRKLPRFSAINADEAIKLLYKQQWWRQVFINKFYRLCRQDNKISIMCMPRFSDFNEGFRNHRISIWIHVVDRGIGVAFMKDDNPFTKDPWHFDKNERLVNKYRRGKRLFQLSTEKKIQIYSRIENFLGVVTYPDLPPELRTRYKELAAKNKYEGLDEELEGLTRSGKREEKWKKRTKLLAKEMQKKHNVTQTEIAKLMGVTIGAVNQW